MKKKKISTHYLEQFLSWLMEAMHPDLAQFEGLNLANRASVRQLVNGYLKPRFDELSPGGQFRVKESLRYGVAMWSEATLQIASRKPIAPSPCHAASQRGKCISRFGRICFAAKRVM